MNNIHFSLQLQKVAEYQALLDKNLSEDAFDDCSWAYYHSIVGILQQLSAQPNIALTGAWDILEDLK